MLKSDQCIAVYCAGEPGVNGCFLETPCLSDGRPMYRKIDSNVGIVWFGGKWYMSDCGEEFTPSGDSHLDYYSSEGSNNGDLPVECIWIKQEDGRGPLPRSKVCNPKELVTLVSALRVAASRYVLSGDTVNAKAHFQTILEIGVALRISDYRQLADVYMQSDNPSNAWDLLVCLSKRDDILFDENMVPRYSLEDRLSISATLKDAFVAVHGERPSIDILTKSLSVNPSILCFIEFTTYICDELKSAVSFVEDGTHELTDTQLEFQLAGGLELAIALRGVYRRIEQYTFGSRDAAVSRMKVFSMTDLFRRMTSDSRPDAKGRDPSFKIFWEVGMTKNDTKQEGADQVYDPREIEARNKDNDPAKEMKCSVIKAINECSEIDANLASFRSIRDRLYKTRTSEKIYQVSDLHNHDCNNQHLKLISIHGIVFDVTENLEKYAPDGEYYFFAGHDITYPLAVSALSGDHVDKLYKLSSVDHLKRVYGWMEYFEKKYKVVGWLGEWDSEDDMPDPPQGEEEPEMQCIIM